ncbi:MAG: VanZ family protein [Candidatus Cloacimonetes bacterium]|nr:VanZ family protein [Candidatus Cloacimonadota bacterium]
MIEKKSSNLPATNLVLYSLLLIITPFLLLQNYLQSAIGIFSRLHFNILGIEIPYLLIVVIVFIVSIVVIHRHQLNYYHLFSWLVVILMLILGQLSTDYYFNHRFYDLQHNWHYIAYAIFAYIMYRFLKSKQFPPERIILYTFISALSISTFDEFIQIPISSRIFDICDIAKDVWGAVMGMVVIFFVIEKGKITSNGWKIRQEKIREYFKHPFSLLFLEAVLSYILLCISSILSDIMYWKISILIIIGLFIIFFFILHKSQNKTCRIIFITIFIIIIVQGFFFIKYHKDNIVYNTYGLTVYKGIPIPFFDIMIYSNGTFRLVDKKHYFNKRDLLTIYGHASDILLIGSGSNGKGGKGFPEQKEVQFIFNTKTKKPLQVIVLKTPEACEEFNRLKNKGYNVLFILHNTC